MVNRMDELNNLNISQWKDTQQYKSRSEVAKPMGDLKPEIYDSYYDRNGTITNAFASDPNDPDAQFLVGTVITPVYNREAVFESLERNAPYLIVSNDGADILFVIAAHRGGEHFSRERPVYPGENKTYYNIYEIRLRSPTAGNQYRVTEYPICCNAGSGGAAAAGSGMLPVSKALIQNTAQPGANTDILATDITPSKTPSTLRVEVAMSSSGNFNAIITNGGTAVTVLLNAEGAPALVATGLYIFDIMVGAGDTVNFQYTVTGGTILILRVQEIDTADA